MEGDKKAPQRKIMTTTAGDAELIRLLREKRQGCAGQPSGSTNPASQIRPAPTDRHGGASSASAADVASIEARTASVPGPGKRETQMSSSNMRIPPSSSPAGAAALASKNPHFVAMELNAAQRRALAQLGVKMSDVAKYGQEAPRKGPLTMADLEDPE